jgi:hypothetical protein
VWKLAKRVETKLLLIWRCRWLKWGNLLTALNVQSVVSQSVNCQKSSVTESKESTNHLPAPQPTKRQTEHCFLCYGIPFHRQTVGRVPHPYSMTGRNDRAAVPARSERETFLNARNANWYEGDISARFLYLSRELHGLL